MFWVRGRDNLRQYLRSKVRRRDLTVPKTGLKLSSSSTRIRFFYFQVSVLFCSKKKQRNKKIFVFFKEKNCQLKNFRGNLFLLLSLVLFRSFCAFRYQTLSLLSEWVKVSRRKLSPRFFCKKLIRFSFEQRFVVSDAPLRNEQFSHLSLTLTHSRWDNKCAWSARRERERERERDREKEIDRARRSKQNFRISTLRCLLLRPTGLFKLK